MGKLKNLTIVFDGNVDVFSPGDVIRGQVILVIESESAGGLENVKGIWLRFVGGARIETRGRSQGLQAKDEGYFDTTQILFGTDPDTTNVRNLTIPLGRQVFPFAIRLPDVRLPAAFEEKFGYVRYQVISTVSLIRTLRNKEHKTERYFSVIGPAVDLNTISGLKAPIGCEVEQRGWFGIGPPVATLSLTMPKQGYVPGESVHLTGRYDNRKGDNQFSIRVKLIQEIHFLFSTNIPISIERVLANIDSQVVCPKGRISNFTIGPLRIPPVPSSGFPGCDLINIEYFILYKDRKFTLTIGTVPLRNAASRRRVLRVADLARRTPSAPPEEADDDAPPSYEQAVSVTDRIAYEMTREDFQNESEFLPRYTYFARMGDLAFASNR